MTRYVNSMHSFTLFDERDPTGMLKTCSPTSGLVMLDHLLWTDRAPDQRSWYPHFRQQMGREFLLAIRMYSEGNWPDGIGRRWCDVDPLVWAAECVRRLRSVPGLIDDPFVCLSPNNEPDLAVEGYSGGASETRSWISWASYEYIWDWQRKWLVEMRRLLGSSPVRLGTGPLAGGHDIPGYPPDYEYRLPEAGAAIEAADVLWVHGYADKAWGDTPEHEGYWFLLRPLRPPGYREQVQGLPPVGGITDPGGALSQYHGKTFILAETGTGRHGDITVSGDTADQFHYIHQRYAATGRCHLVAPFIWWAGAMHGGNRIADNASLVAAMQGMERIAAADWPPAGGGTIVADDPRIQQLLDQNALLTQALVAIREGRWTGAGGVDGLIVALNGGKLPDGYAPTFPKP